MTFIIAFLVSRGARPGEVSVFWVVLGVAAITGGFARPPLIAGLRGGTAGLRIGLTLSAGVLAAGALIALAQPHPAR